MSETEGDTKTVEAPPPFDPSRDGSLGVERCRAALVEILGRNVTEESIASKMEEDERDASQISFGDFRWLLSECENDFDMADEAEEEAKRLRDEEAEQRGDGLVRHRHACADQSRGCRSGFAHRDPRGSCGLS